MGEDLISVGIDIGTTTTQIMFSRLKVDNQSSFFMAPDISIVEKEIIYKGNIYFTPLISMQEIDADRVREIVAREYELAGIQKGQVDTGAVIITGESAKKENARAVLDKLSEFAGDFVVATAGPDLESIIAGKGSGACAYSKENHCKVINLDIGGGTTNIVLFVEGEVKAKTCVDIGGRLIRVGASANNHKTDLSINYISTGIKELIASLKLTIGENKAVNLEDLRILNKKMSEVLLEAAGLKTISKETQKLLSRGSSPLMNNVEVDAIFFSGGVADLIKKSNRNNEVTKENYFTYGDIGEFLGEAIAQQDIFMVKKVDLPSETIRATVIGAGMYTTEISGSTITFTKDIFPIKNVPVLYINIEEIQKLINGHTKSFTNQINWFIRQRDSDKMIIGFEGFENPHFAELDCLAKHMAQALDVSDYKREILIVIKQDMAKAFGQAMKRHIKTKREIVCIDKISVFDGDYVDMGKPFMNNMAIPVVVKTLIFA